MAILNNYQDENTGLIAEKAYYKARKAINLVKDMVFFSCDIYASEQARRDWKNPLASIEYSISTNIPIEAGEDARAKQLYWLIKTIPEFKDAIDC